MSLRRGIVALSLCVLFACPAPMGEAPTVHARTFPLRGVVVDDLGAPIANAKVMVNDAATTTNVDGEFDAGAVTEGSIVLEVSADGHRSRAIALRVPTGAARETITLETPGKQLEIAFVGDIMFARRYLDPNADGTRTNAIASAADPQSFVRVVDHVAPFTRTADLAIPNVETVIADHGAPHPTKPFVLLSPPASVAGLQALGVDLVSLANNHVYDYFDAGLASTMKAIHDAGITTFGAGGDESDAYKSTVVPFGESGKLGIASFCGVTGRGLRLGEEEVADEPPFFDALAAKGGVARATAQRFDEVLKPLRPTVDALVVILHHGLEYSPTPSALQVKNAHEAIDRGADLVVAHHPHVLQPFEIYKGKLIAHSLGDFVFDQETPETWASLVLRAHVDDVQKTFGDFSFDPVYFDAYVPYPSTGKLARSIVRSVAATSAPLGVTIFEDGTRGRVVTQAPETLINSDTTHVVQPMLDVDGKGWTLRVENELAANEYLLSAFADDGSTRGIAFGRDILRAGSFEPELAGAPLDRVWGWDVVSPDVVHLADDANDGRLSLAMCRDATSINPVGTYSSGRHVVRASSTYSFCGCLRGNEVNASAYVAYWSTLDAKASSLQEIAVTPPAPANDGWQCFCQETKPPPGAFYVNVHLATQDASMGGGCHGVDAVPHCAEWDSVRLVEWNRSTTPPVVPNDIDFVHVDGATPSAVRWVSRKLVSP